MGDTLLVMTIIGKFIGKEIVDAERKCIYLDNAVEYNRIPTEKGFMDLLTPIGALEIRRSEDGSNDNVIVVCRLSTDSSHYKAYVEHTTGIQSLGGIAS